MSTARRLCSMLVLSGAVLAVGSCYLKSKGPVPEWRVSLEIRNRSYFEVDVYALPAVNGPRVRIATAPSFRNTVLGLRRDALRAGGSLVLQLHGIGSNRSWVTPEISLSEGLTACLDIESDSGGDLSRSSFYTAATPDSVPPSQAGKSVACGFGGSSDLSSVGLDVALAGQAAHPSPGPPRNP